MKRLYRQTGVSRLSTIFLFSDTQAAEESFMEDINNLLSSGDVPNLFKPDEFEEIYNAIIDQAKREGIDESAQVRNNGILQFWAFGIYIFKSFRVSRFVDTLSNEFEPTCTSSSTWARSVIPSVIVWGCIRAS